LVQYTVAVTGMSRRRTLSRDISLIGNDLVSMKHE